MPVKCADTDTLGSHEDGSCKGKSLKCDGGRMRCQRCGSLADFLAGKFKEIPLCYDCDDDNERKLAS